MTQLHNHKLLEYSNTQLVKSELFNHESLSCTNTTYSIPKSQVANCSVPPLRCCSITLLLCYSVTLLLTCSITLLLCYSVTQAQVTQLPSRSITQSLRYLVAQSLKERITKTRVTQKRGDELT